MAATIGIFDMFQQSNELYNTWEQHKQEEERKRLQPLADLLLDNIVWPSILDNKAEIFEALQTKCRAATHATELQVPVWSFSHVADYPRLGTNLDRAREIKENGWRQMVSVHAEDSMGPPSGATVWKVIKKTDFCSELAKRFGRDYTINTLTSDYVEETDSTGAVYYHYTVHLMLNYFPYGLTDYHREAKERFEEIGWRLRRSLMPGEKFTLWCSEAEGQLTVYGPPSTPWIKVVSSPICYCGYAHESDEE